MSIGSFDMDKEFALKEAIDLIHDIMVGFVNPEDECEKFLRDFAPDKLRDDITHDRN
tara:strand:+ start:76 stop:246 length:171 start_codon:yes stop_codon:yes gene_type:complete